MNDLRAPSPKADCVANFSLAVRRFTRVWTTGVPAAAGRRFKRSWPFWLAGAIAALLSAWLLDVPSVEWARRLPSPVRSFFSGLTDYGKSGWLLYPSGILCLVLLLADWRSVERRIAAAWTEFGILAGFAFFSIAGSGITTNIVKQFVGRGRPKLFDEHGAFSFLPFQYDYANASFPSGHATTMGAVAVIVAVIAPRLAVPAFLICAVVAASRVVVGSHFPSDVVAGFMLGGAFTWFYAIALALAGIGFAVSPAGRIRARTVAIRRVFGQWQGLPMALSGLWSAIAHRGSRTASA